MQNKAEILKDFLNGFWRGIRFRWHQMSKRAMMPCFITYQITNRCNARCKMCNIWKKGRREEELTLKEIEKLSSDPIFRKLRLINITGGEPFIREDLKDIAVLIASRATNLREISFATNGFLTEKITKDISYILKNTDRQLRISVSISIDGFEELHEEIRGVKGIFQKAVNTIKELQDLNNQRIGLHIRTTVSPYNVKHIDKIYSTLKNITEDVAFNLSIISPNYYANVEDASALQLSEDEKKHIIEFCKQLMLKEPKRAYFLDTMIEICRSGRRKMPCTGGYAMLYIAPNGDIFPCNIVPGSFLMGNIRKESLSKVWFSGRSKDIRKKLSDYDYCKRCEDNCDYATIVREDFYDFLFFLLKRPKTLLKVANYLLKYNQNSASNNAYKG